MIRKLLDLSTAHLSHETRAWLTEEGTRTASMRVFASANDVTIFLGATPFGWLVYADEAASAEPAGPNMPDDLWQCMARARHEGCEYLLFDADATELDGLMTYHQVPTNNVIPFRPSAGTAA